MLFVSKRTLTITLLIRNCCLKPAIEETVTQAIITSTLEIRMRTLDPKSCWSTSAKRSLLLWFWCQAKPLRVVSNPTRSYPCTPNPENKVVDEMQESSNSKSQNVTSHWKFTVKHHVQIMNIVSQQCFPVTAYLICDRCHTNRSNTFNILKN